MVEALLACMVMAAVVFQWFLSKTRMLPFNEAEVQFLFSAPLLPGWAQVGKEHQRGMEAMGQRFVSGILTSLSLLIAVVPAALLFLVLGVTGYRLIGLAIVPIASFVAGCALPAEAALATLWIRRPFDRFDVSKECRDDIEPEELLSFNRIKSLVKIVQQVAPIFDSDRYSN